MSNKLAKDFLKTSLSLVLGIAIIWLLYRNTNIDELLTIAKSANIKIILLSLLFGFIGNFFRGLRWELLINSLGYKPKRASIVYAVFGNYAVNFLLPRAGDVWRCAVVSKHDKIPLSKSVETYLVDKALDLFAAIIVLLASIILSGDFFISYLRNNPEFVSNIKNIFSSVWLYIGIAAIGLLIFLTFKFRKQNTFLQKIANFFKTIKHDLNLIRKMKEKKLLIFYTILVWLAFYLYFYICFYAFDFTKPLGAIVGLTVFAMSNIGIAVPVQGGIGAWHFMVISSLVVFGVAYEQASAFAGVVFIIQSVWIILLGVFSIIALPHVKRDKSIKP